MKSRLKRLWAMVRKETIQMVRDWPTLGMVIVLPVVELFLVSYMGASLLDHMPTIVADQSLDSHSRAFVNALEVSGFFAVTEYVDSEAAVIRAIDEGEAYVGVVIPPNFAERVAQGDAQALVILDGSDTFIVQSAYSAAGAIAQAHGMELMMNTARRMGRANIAQLPINTFIRILYNPNIDELIFLIPGMTAMLLQLVCVNITVSSVVRERELGTIEQILVTPTRPLELIMGKMVPPILVVTADLFIIIGLGVYWFKVPFQGSLPLFCWLSLLFIISSLGMGVLFSTICKNQKQAQQISAMLMMFTMLLSGLLYPRATMPPVVQFIGNLIPATYFIRIARGIITKGVGISFLWNDVIALLIYAAVIVLAAGVTFKRRLD
ncbi:MAG TPA: ABC transporter permease [Anaerolineae bacterium]|nr:ABC transporter permease [Anaerolineae bacterium]